MRIIFLGLTVFIGVNLFLTIINSQTVNRIQERNQAIESLINQ